MDVLPLHFRGLYYGGLWWETAKQHWLANYIWKPLVVNIMFFCALSMMSALAVPGNDVKDITKILFISLTVLATWSKMVNFLIKRESVIELLGEFRKPICVPRSAEESDILRKNTRIIPIVFKCYLFFAYSSGTLFLSLPLLRVKEGTGRMSFPFDTYEIFSRENVAYYSVTYAFQAVAAIIGISLNACLDTMLAGFVCLTGGQIDLCCRRFASGDRDDALGNMKTCVEHHVVIRNIARHLESIFMGVFVPFLFTSLVILCTSVYNLSQSGIGNGESILYIVCTGAVLMQVFFYCSFGSELTAKGFKISEILYDYDWRALTLIERKNLLFIMLVCHEPLSLSFHGYCTLSLDIYVWILNASYGAYNILQAITNGN